jgi:hypothetical protein
LTKHGRKPVTYTGDWFCKEVVELPRCTAKDVTEMGLGRDSTGGNANYEGAKEDRKGKK